MSASGLLAPTAIPTINSIPLLTTKLYVPRPRPRVVPRPHLMARLDEGLAQKLTLLSAPAGFGKTTLICEWITLHREEQDSTPVAWVSLDVGDNDPVRFWRYILTASKVFGEGISNSSLVLLNTSPQPPFQALLTSFINDLVQLSAKAVLVLEDYHVITAAQVHETVTYFLDYLPSTLHLTLMTRSDPPLPLARLRARNELDEIRTEDLRFSLAETQAYLELALPFTLSPEMVSRLASRTEGWIAGLQMAALSLRQREAAAVAQFIEEFSGSHRYVMDYLVDEVLQGQPAEVQTFLLSTSILDRLCAPLCDSVFRTFECLNVGTIKRSNEMLEYLERANLFIHPLDDRRHWYRYHPLFADLLRHRVSQIYPDQVSALHLSASQWYEQAGLTDPAIQHALAAQAFGRTAALVEQVAPAMIERSEMARLLSWLDALPEDVVEARPRLALYIVQIFLVSGQYIQAASRLEAIEAILAMDEAKRTPEVQGHMAALQTYLAQEAGDFAATIALSRQALAHLPEQDSLLRIIVTLTLAYAYYFQDEFEPASQLLTEIIATGQTAPRMASTLSAIYLQTQILKAQGALQKALQLCQEGLELVARRGWHNFPAISVLYTAFGDLLRERNELATATEYLEKGIQLGQEGGITNILIIGNVWLAWMRQTQGDVTGSQEAIRAALQLIHQHEVSHRALPHAACYQARLWIAQGDLAAASRWARASDLSQAINPITYNSEVEYLTLARLWIAQGNLEDAETLLLQLYQAAAGRNGSLIEILILQALTFAAQDRLEQALSALEQALRLAEPEGFVRVFLDEGAPMAELLRRAVAQGLHASYALYLLEAFGAGSKPVQPLVEPLSERELEVLRLIAAGLSNRAIAEELVIAAGTVKRHISNIYGKLGVNNRVQAVAEARTLNLL